MADLEAFWSGLPGSCCSTVRCCTWSPVSRCTCCSRSLPLWRTPDNTKAPALEMPNFTTESCCPPARRLWNLPPGCRSRTPLPAPQSHFRTQEGPTAARETVSSFHKQRHTPVSVSVSAGGLYLRRFVEETRSSTAVQEVVELLHVAVGELLGQVVTVNAGARSDKSRGIDACSAVQKQLKCNSCYFSPTTLETA